ncbi:MAG: tetratricopeptide repeat protein [Proteobacteria bacterium]|nr:tetratricopeptide repeat protein [Pseudomonadota bacterium]
MWKTICAGTVTAIIVLSFVASCTSLKSYSVYSNNLFLGKKLMKEGEYKQAQEYFAGALKGEKDSTALVCLAVTCYKLNDLDNAEKFVLEAEKVDGNSVNSLRILGYKALILLKKNDPGGLKALGDYITLYGYLYPLESIEEVKMMYSRQEVDIERLDKLIEEQIKDYEQDMDMFINLKIGFYDRHSGSGDMR